MEFGVFVATKIDDWQLIREAEALGYDRAWVPDSQMIWSDCYATLAVAAANTTRIKLGTGVAIPGTRLAPVTAHAIASINRLAPGRVFLGIGTGHTAMRVMGMPPMGFGAFCEYVRVVRALLRGDEVDYTHDGVTRTIRFLHLDRGFIAIDPPIPIYLAANAPRMLVLTGEVADGHVAMGNERPRVLARHLTAIRGGAAKAGRTLPDGFHTTALTSAVVLRPGEAVDSDRVVARADRRSRPACTSPTKHGRRRATTRPSRARTRRCGRSTSTTWRPCGRRRTSAISRSTRATAPTSSPPSAAS